MKSDWFILLRDLGVITLVSYFLQKIINVFFDKKLENHKQDLSFTIRDYQLALDRDLEKYKSDASFFLKKQNSLHEKRLIIIDEMYKKLVHLDSTMRHMMAPVQLIFQDAQKEEEDRISQAQTAFADYNNYFLLNKLYFSKDISNVLEEIRKEYYSANWNYFTVRRNQSFTGEKSKGEEWQSEYEVVQSASKKVREDIPKILEKLENLFRHLLGVEEAN